MRTLTEYEKEEQEFERLCPVCDVCGEPIKDDYYYEVGGMIFHLDCAERRSVDNYVEAKKYGY